MRGIFGIFISLVPAVSLLSCSRELSPSAENTGSRVIEFCTGDPSTKVSISGDVAPGCHLVWNENDQIGIYATRNGRVIGQNYPYSAIPSVFGSGARLQFSSSAYQFRWQDSGEYVFNAYYPFSGVPDNGNDYAVPAEIKTLQNQVAAGDASSLGKYILMKAQTSVTDKQGQVNLDFRSLVSIVELKIKLSGSSAALRNINAVVMSAGDALSASTAHILVNTSEDFGAGLDPLVLNQTVDSVEVDIETPYQMTAYKAGSIYMVVAPGHHPAGSIRVKAVTVDNRECEVTVPAGVDFEANCIYSRTVEFDNSSFVPSGRPYSGPSYRYVPVSSLDALRLGSVIPTYYIPSLDRHCLLTCAPVNRSAPATSLEEIGAGFDEFGNITYMPSEGFVWNLGKDGDCYTLTFISGGQTYQLIGCDQTQGAAISTNLSGYSSYSGYTNTWRAVETAEGLQFMTTASTSRYLYPYYDPDASVPIIVPTWRQAKTLQGGHFVFYYREDLDQ